MPLDDLLEGNRVWAAGVVERDPGFFRRLEAQQAPRYLWIGCSDSRVPANEIVGTRSGRVLRPSQRREPRRAHRPQLPVGAAVRGRGAQDRGDRDLRAPRLRRRTCRARRPRHGLIDNWLRHVQDVAHEHSRPAGLRSGGRPRRPAVSAQRDRAGHERLPHDDRPGGVGPGCATQRARSRLRPRRWRAARPRGSTDGPDEVDERRGGRWRGSPRVCDDQSQPRLEVEGWARFRAGRDRRGLDRGRGAHGRG